MSYRCLSCNVTIRDMGTAVKHSTNGCKVVPKNPDVDMATWDSQTQGDY